jgi:hypothetical protein
MQKMNESFMIYPVLTDPASVSQIEVIE